MSLSITQHRTEQYCLNVVFTETLQQSAWLRHFITIRAKADCVSAKLRRSTQQWYQIKMWRRHWARQTSYYKNSRDTRKSHQQTMTECNFVVVVGEDSSQCYTNSLTNEVRECNVVGEDKVKLQRVQLLTWRQHKLHLLPITQLNICHFNTPMG